MKLHTIIAVAVSGLVLTACAGMDNEPREPRHQERHEHRHEHAQNRMDERNERNARFECENGVGGSLSQTDVNGLRISLNTDSQSAHLPRVRAASGALFASDNGLYGKRTEWHEKNGEAVFQFADPYGNVVETRCRLKSSRFP